MISVVFTENPIVAIVLISLAVTFTMFTLAASWAICLDIGGSHVGVVSATMNTAGQIGSIFSPPLVTWLLARGGDWNAPVLAIGAFFILGAACWCLVDPRDRVLD